MEFCGLVRWRGVVCLIITDKDWIWVKLGFEMGTAGRDFEERDRREEEQQCRICANEVTRKDGVHIFAEEGKRHYLQSNIRKYLYILVSSKDTLRN